MGIRDSSFKVKPDFKGNDRARVKRRGDRLDFPEVYGLGNILLLLVCVYARCLFHF